MKKLKIYFMDTDETLTLDEDLCISAWGNSDSNGLSPSYNLEFNEMLPKVLRGKPLMFFVCDDIPILKLYRSVYIEKMEWID